MMLNITTQEWEYLIEVLETNHKQMLHELHHTDTAAYKRELKQKIKLVEDLKSKVQSMAASAP